MSTKSVIKKLFSLCLALVLLCSPILTAIPVRAAGEVVVSTRQGESLPTELVDAGIDAKHVWQYPASTLSPAGQVTTELVTDENAYLGQALLLDTNLIPDETRADYLLGSSGKRAGMYVKDVNNKSNSNMMNNVRSSSFTCNDGTYHLVKLADNITPAKDMAQLKVAYMWLLNFEVRSFEMPIDAATMSNHPVDIYVSVKVDGSFNATEAGGHPKYYIDRFVMVSECEMGEFVPDGNATCSSAGTVSATCSLCGKKDTKANEDGQLGDHKFTNYVSDGTGKETASCDYGCGTTDTRDYLVPESNRQGESLSAELVAAGIDAKHIWQYPVSTLSPAGVVTTELVDDEKAYLGKALLLDTNLISDETRADYLLGSSGKRAGLYIKDANDKKNNNTMNAVRASHFTCNDGEYHLVKLADNVTPAKDMAQPFKVSYMWFLNFEVRNFDMPADVAKMPDHPVDIYVSVKVDGDFGASQAGGYPKYYIDRFVMVSECSMGEYISDRNATCSSAGTVSATCSLCGKKDTKANEDGQLGDHKFTNYVNDGTGKEVATCDYGCGTTDTRAYLVPESDRQGESLSAELVAAGIDAKHIWQYSAATLSPAGQVTTELVTDENAYLGQALLLDTNLIPDETRADYLLGSSGKRAGLYIKDANDKKNNYMMNGVRAAHFTCNDGKYHLVKLADNITPAKDMAQPFKVNYMWFLNFEVRSFDLPGDVAKMPDHPVDVYVSVKVDGDFGASQAGGYPKYYIDRIVMVSECAMSEYTSDGNATCTADGTKSAVCSLCGKKDTVTDEASKIAHVFTNYVFNNDASGDNKGTETAACDFGCGITDTRKVGENPLILGAMQVVLPVNATEVESSAADELILHVKKMTGETMEKVTEGEQTGNAVYIGATQFAADHNVTFNDNEFGEGWAIKAVDGNLVLTGGAKRGALYAVYHLLEDVLGVRWWNLWEEYIPQLTVAKVPSDYADSGVPAFAYRDLYITGGALEQQSNMFFTRNRLNGLASNSPTELGGEEDFGVPYHVHTFKHYFRPYYETAGNDERQAWLDAVGNPDRIDYYTAYPEWFHYSTAVGGRVDTGLCLSNGDLLEAFKDKLIKTIQYSFDLADQNGEARPRYFDASPADRKGHCECDACAASIATHGASGYILTFVNELAAAVAEAFPNDEVYLETLAYWDYVEAPLDDTKPADNVIIRFADNYMDILHDINNPTNATFKEQLEKWAKIVKPGNLYLWDYAVIYANNGIFPSMYKYAENFQTFKELGVNGYFVEHESVINTDFWDMKAWMMTKLMEDPYQDQDALMDEFIYSYYGAEAGPYIREYLDYMHERAEACTGSFNFGASIIGATWLTGADIVKGNELFDKAFEAAGDDEVLMRRLRNARSGLDRVIVESYKKWTTSAAANKLDWNMDEKKILRRIVQTLTEQLEFRGAYDSTIETVQLADYKARLEEQESLPAELPEELKNIDREHIYEFSVDDFKKNSGEILVDDDSRYGKAVVYDLGKMTASDPFSFNDEYLQEYWALGNEPGQGILVGNWRERPATNYTEIGEIYAKDIVADGKYHLIKLDDRVMIDTMSYMYFFFFRDWNFQIPNLPQAIGHLLNQKLDFYVSMKVEGDVTLTDKTNLPVYSIDRVFVVDECRDYWTVSGTEEATCAKNATETKVCGVCGKTETVEIPDTKLEHSFTIYVSDNNATEEKDGTKTAKCDHGCGAVKSVIDEGTKLIVVADESVTVREGAVENAIEAAGQKDTAVLDLTKYSEGVTNVEMPVAALEAVAEAGKDLQIATKDATVTFDAKALEAIVEAAGTEDEVTIVLEKIDAKELNDKQQKALKNKKVAGVISVSILCGDKYVSNFKGGSATVEIPFTPEEGYKGNDYKVYYVADDGKITSVPTKYADGKLIVTLNHFSEYVIVNEAASDVEESNPESGNAQTGDMAPLTIMGVILVASMLAIGIIVSQKKFRLFRN